MEEREALKRQIDLLQNLINKHKSLHGDAPFPRVQQRLPEASMSATPPAPPHHQPHSLRGGENPDRQSHGSWRKTYSLKNKTPQKAPAEPAAPPSFSSSSSSLRQAAPQTLLGSRREQTAAFSRLLEKNQDHTRIVAGKPRAESLHQSNVQKQPGGQASSLHGLDSTRIKPPLARKTAAESKQTPPDAAAPPTALPKLPKQPLTSLHGPRTGPAPHSDGPAPHGGGLASQSGGPAPHSVPTPHTVPTPHSSGPAPHIGPAPRSGPAPHTVPTPRSGVPAPRGGSTDPAAPLVRKSKFMWVKSQSAGGGAEPKQSVSSPSPAAKVVSAGSASPPPPLAISRRTPGKKLPRRLSPVVVGAPKASKYRWVSSSVGVHGKPCRKPPSPRAPLEAARKLRSGSAPSCRPRRAAAALSAASSPGSRYRWKAAGGQRSSPVAVGGAAPAMPVARRRSAFHWTSVRAAAAAAASTSAAQCVSPPASSPAAFKLRSRMKIIRRSSSSSSERSSPVAVAAAAAAARSSPRGRPFGGVRTPVGARRGSCRELVSFGRHKLRRLSPTASRSGPAPSSHRSPASPRVFRTRYKMVTRPGSAAVAPSLHYNPALSWRAKRIQTARSFLQSRRRSSPSRYPSCRWREPGVRWIGGSLYRVSANKLSRTAATSAHAGRTGRSSSSAHISPSSHSLSRASSTRHLASRAVQRSLAIIRHSRQRKQQRQYCMYYNRFGRCNRGSSCPYIHDPDKVAVCTRFLRGTCKQADGTCPFSHKVAKEKMPVCSYFLRGICNNSDCPYSHVYVSRKAQVCDDFVRGYCPAGEKCKKKHTLVCPDFSRSGSCPQGARCKLRHRQRPKRNANYAPASAPDAQAARAHRAESKRPRLSVDTSATPTRGSLALPSFISLSSSPEEADAPSDLPSAEAPQVKEKRLQIKPRL